MANNITGAADADSTRVDLGQREYESVSAGPNWTHEMTENHYAWVFIVGSLALLWALGASFR